MSLPRPTTGGKPALDPRELEALDAPLIALANQSGGDLRKLFHAFFDFLNRRTDFYLVPHEDDKDSHLKMGFREGDAEKLLLAAFRQFPLRRMPRKGAPSTATAESEKPAQAAVAPVAEEKGNSAKPTEVKDSDSPKPVQGSKQQETDSPGSADWKAGVHLNEEGLQIPVGNGGSTERYKWTQTIEECSVLIAVPKNIRGKDLEVKMRPTHVSVRSKKPLDDGETDPHTFLDGTLAGKIVTDESTWTLEGGVLVLVLYKDQKTFWETIIEGDDKIDTTLVDSRRHISEYDESTQAQMRKMIFDQNQERRGKPLSDEIIGGKPKVPPLPPGVEYISKETLEAKTEATKS